MANNVQGDHNNNEDNMSSTKRDTNDKRASQRGHQIMNTTGSKQKRVSERTTDADNSLYHYIQTHRCHKLLVTQPATCTDHEMGKGQWRNARPDVSAIVPMDLSISKTRNTSFPPPCWIGSGEEMEGVRRNDEPKFRNKELPHRRKRNK